MRGGWGGGGGGGGGGAGGVGGVGVAVDVAVGVGVLVGTFPETNKIVIDSPSWYCLSAPRDDSTTNPRP